MRSRPNARGPKPSPRFRVTLAFLDAIRASGRPMYWLALCAGFPHLQSLSTLLHADGPRTPVNVERLTKLATVIEFSGDVFEDGV